MHLYTIGDLHLSYGVPEKPMDIFGGWENYQALLEKNWRARVQPEDTVVLAGDLSWGMTLSEAAADFSFVDGLPGQKIILKGNHDYWWTSLKKMETFFVENGFSTLHILHNNHYEFAEYGICGTRGWVSMQGEPADEKIVRREAQRLDVSLQSAERAGLLPIVFLHYPPAYGKSVTQEIVDVLQNHHITECYYGHLHGKAHTRAIQGEWNGIQMKLIASDYLKFCPELVR